MWSQRRLSSISFPPAGSANGLAINLFGVKDTFNVPLACLNAIKGHPLPLDLCAIVRRRAASESPAEAAADGEGFLERRWSFMSQAMGLMCDLDLGTENMRWMGDARFVVGFLKGSESGEGRRSACGRSPGAVLIVATHRSRSQPSDALPDPHRCTRV